MCSKHHTGLDAHGCCCHPSSCVCLRQKTGHRSRATCQGSRYDTRTLPSMYHLVHSHAEDPPMRQNHLLLPSWGWTNNTLHPQHTHIHTHAVMATSYVCMPCHSGQHMPTGGLWQGCAHHHPNLVIQQDRHLAHQLHTSTPQNPADAGRWHPHAECKPDTARPKPNIHCCTSVALIKHMLAPLYTCQPKCCQPQSHECTDHTADQSRAGCRH